MSIFKQGYLMMNQKYLLIKKIDQGAFGEIYKGKNLQTNQLVAIKIEKNISSFPNEANCSNSANLTKEIRILSFLQTEPRFPKLHAYGYEKKHLFMVMSYLGDSLEKKLKKCWGFFSLQTVCKIAIQSLEILSIFHNQGFVHRDIKPENFLCGFGKDEEEMIYLIDFGLSKRYLNNKNEHINFQNKKGFTGTIVYASINTHREYEQSRRDDLISLGYCLIYFLQGFLPWQDLIVDNRKEKFSKIREMKEKIGYDELTANVHFNINKYMQNVFELGFFDKPDYELLINLFKEILMGKEEKDISFDWNIMKKQKQKAKISKKTTKLMMGIHIDSERLKKISAQENINIKNSLIMFEDSLEKEKKSYQSKSRAKSISKNSKETEKIKLNLSKNLKKIQI